MAGMQLPEYLKGKSADELKQMADEVKSKQVGEPPKKA
jgi:flotillin